MSSSVKKKIETLENELKATCADDQKEIAALRERNASLVARLAKLRMENKELVHAREISSSNETEISDLRAMENRLKTDVARLSDQCEKQKQKIEDDKRAIEKLQLLLKEEEEEHQFFTRRAQRQIEDLEKTKSAEIESLQEIEERLTEEVVSLRRECETLETEVAQGEESLLKLQRKLSEAQSLLERATAEHERKLTETLELLEKTKLDCAKLIEATKADCDSKIAESQNVTAKTKEELNRKLARLTDGAWGKDLEIERLQATETTLTIEVARLAKENEEQKRKIEESAEAIQELQARYATSQAEIAALKQDSERRLADLLHNLTQRSEALSGTRAELNEEIQRLRSECADYRQQLKASHEQITELRCTVSSQQLEIQKAKFEADRQVSAMKADHALEMKSKDTELAGIKADCALQIKSMKTEIESTRQACERQVRSLQAEMDASKETSERQLARVTQSFELELEKFRGAESKLTNEIAALKAERVGQVALLKETKKLVTDLEKSQDEQSRSNARLEREIEQFQKSEALLSSQVAKLQSECASMRNVIDEQTRMRSGLEQANRILQKAFEDQAAEMENAKTAAATLQKEIEAKNEKFADRQKAFNELQRQFAMKAALLSDLESETDTVRKSLDEKTLLLEQAKAEISSLQRAVQSGVERQDAFASAERERLQKWSAQLSCREQQLRHYASALSKEKAEMLGFSKQIAGEIEMVSRTHPLKDYVKVTEFELSKIEAQLKTMPTLAPERARLEAAVNQLIEQRDFLKSILVNAEKQFETQLKNLEKIHKSGKLAAVPPPPPSKVESSASPTARIQWESTVRDLD